MNVQVIAEIPISVRRWKAYRSYKDSGIKWLGVIPEHWEVKRIKFLASFHGGGTPSKANLDYWNGDIPWVSPKDMKSETVNDSEDHITEEALATSATQLVRPGAVLIVVRSGILKHSIPVAINMRPVALNQDMKAMVPRSSLTPHYLKYLIVGHQNALLVEWRKAGATVESIEHELLVNSYFPIPSLDEQCSIVDLLDRETAKVDVLVAKKKRLIELLQEKRAVLITRAVTKGLDPNVPMKDSGIEWLGEIPAHWETKMIKHALSLCEYGISDALSGDGPIRVLTMGNIQDGRVIIPEAGCLDYVSESMLLKRNDLLFNRTNSLIHVGKVGLFEGDGEQKVTFASYLVRIRGKATMSPRFLVYLLNIPPLLEFARSLALPSINQANLNPTRYGQIKVGVPLLREQHAIGEYLDRESTQIDGLIAKVREGIEKLKEYRTALISAAVTGKIDVREDGVA